MTSTQRQGRLSDDTDLLELPLSQLIPQCLLVMPGVTSSGRPDAATLSAVRAGVGTLHSVVDMSASSAAAYHREIRETALDAGLIPPLISGNLESGVGYSLGRTGTDLPYPHGIGLADDEDVAYRAALLAAEEARAIGYDWTFSPCIDVVMTDRDPILGVRAFGHGPARTGVLGAAQIRGFRDGGVASTAKHFPGHGDSAVDSHLGLPVIDRSDAEHRDVHLPPFIAAIDAGVSSIMVGHVVLTRHGFDVPASLSHEVNAGWIRRDLGYDGVIISDSLRMAAVAARWSAPESAVLALAAGADVANAKCEADALPVLIEAVRNALDTAVLNPNELRRSAGRLVRMRRELESPASSGDPSTLDSPRPWNDPARSNTVDLSGSIRRQGRSLAVSGDSDLAHRLTRNASGRGIFVRRLAEGERPNSDELLVDVVVPHTAVSDDDARRIELLAESSELLVLNGVVRADTVRRGAGAVIVAPAVDTFGIVSEAAVDAIIDQIDS